MNLRYAGKADKTFQAVSRSVLLLVLLVTMYPLYYVLIASISDATAVSGGEVVLFPVKPNLEAYTYIFQDPTIVRGYLNSLFYAVAQAGLSLCLTLPAAYALSRADLPGRNLVMLYMVFTMYFTGGIIPFFVLIKQIGFMNSVLSLIVPNAVNVFNIIIARTFFASNIPKELLESAQLDGCSNTRFFLKIVLPLSGAIVSIVVLFNVVQNWNAFFHAMLFIRDITLYPLQLILRKLILQSDFSAGEVNATLSPKEIFRRQQIADLLKFALIVVAAGPLLIVYPFVQRHFVRGIMVGSIKG